jgi:hypothetical protein
MNEKKIKYSGKVTVAKPEVIREVNKKERSRSAQNHTFHSVSVFKKSEFFRNGFECAVLHILIIRMNCSNGLAMLEPTPL